ncbi:IS3 family transposase [Ktedonobacteria bacterium brp13]|nr:IS3 family transposase [Ktedonobacteria bacterium brp13]
MADHRQAYPITVMCRVLDVSVSGYYAWCKREPSRHSREDAQLAEQVKVAFQANRCVYGSPARRRPPTGLLHHTDRGSTYTGESYQALLRHAGMVTSMSRTADCYDNAAMESFFHSFKGECLESQSFQTRAQARSATFEYIETFYNRTRRHSTLHYVSPLVHEQLMC